MKQLNLALALLLAAVTLGCDANTLGYVEKPKYRALQKELEATKAQLETVKAQMNNCRRYDTIKTGLRTWRLDTVTGATCLLFSTEADWKKPETQYSACQ